MTVMCGLFFAIPQSAVRLGIVKRLSPCALKLYIALWHESERCSTREFKRTIAELIDLVGGARNSHSKAREELKRAGLVVSEPIGQEGYVFRLCDPQTGKPWPLNPREPVPYNQRKAVSTASPQNPPKSRETQRIEDIGTDFEFGFNASQNASETPSEEATISPLRWDEIGSKR